MFVNPHIGSPVTAKCCASISFKRSDIIYNQGDAADHWYEIVSGAVRTCFFNRRGQRQVTAFYYGGDVFGVDNCTYVESAEAITDLMVRAHRLCPDDADEICDASGIFRRALDLSRQRVVLLGRKTALQRVAAFILGLPSIGSDGNRRFLPMSRADIADHLCLTIHTVSRIISNLIRNGIIRIENKKFLVINSLEDMLDISGDEQIGAEEKYNTGIAIYNNVVNAQEYRKWIVHKS